DDRAVQAVNGEDPDDAVTMMTLHNAKGLEFPVVFLVGLEENLIPHRSTTASLQEIEEERRLLYVGVTRAQDELYLVHAESRLTFGRTEPTRPSRFLEDIPRELLQDTDVFGQDVDDPRHLSRFSRNTWRPASPLPSSRAGTELAGATSLSGTGYKGGERVKHPKFGAGMVVGLSGEGAKTEITVVFESAGAKRLLLKYASLERA
ncbi:MAG TPA: 3'-5' exonuclease, partial [Trueperaceae bacterium]|nr:3'-5' exonuclease [Trueperaceae bacterium]